MNAMVAAADEAPVQRPALEALPRHTRCPVSFNQEQRLIGEALAQRRGANLTAHLPTAFRIRGALDGGCLEWALNYVVQRHAALRATYIPTESIPPSRREEWLRAVVREGRVVSGLYCQSVLTSVRVPVERWQNHRGVGTDTELGQIVDDVASTLRYDEPPLMRAGLMNVGPDDHVLVIVASHLATDAWSGAVFLRELFRSYCDALRGTPCELRPPSVQHPDFAAWEQKCLDAGVFRREESYWHAQWSESSTARIRPDDLPFALPSGRFAEPAIDVVQAPLGDESSANVRRLLKMLGITPYVFFRSVVTVALHQLSKRRRIALYANFANRRHPATEQMIGWCANRHLLVADLKEDPRFIDLCRQVATSVSEARRHEALPLPALWLRIGRTLEGKGPRIGFDVWPKRTLEENDVSFEPLIVPGGRKWMNLDIRVHDEGALFTFVVTYDRSRHASEGVTSMTWGLQRLAAHVIDRMQCRVSELIDSIAM